MSPFWRVLTLSQQIFVPRWEASLSRKPLQIFSIQLFFALLIAAFRFFYEIFQTFVRKSCWTVDLAATTKFLASISFVNTFSFCLNQPG